MNDPFDVANYRSQIDWSKASHAHKISIQQTAVVNGRRAGGVEPSHQCPRCFGLFKVGDRFWNDSGTVYHWICWVNKSKEKNNG